MKIKISRVADYGISDNERIILDVTEDCNLGNYIIAMSKAMQNKEISSNISNILWLENTVLKKGDIVVIYTVRKGDEIKSFTNSTGAKSHFCFWNLDKTLKEYDDFRVVCFETSWTTLHIDNQKSNQDAEGNQQ